MTERRKKTIRIGILTAICVLSIILVFLMKGHRNISGFFDFSQPDKLIVTAWDCIFTALALFGLICLSMTVREWFGIRFDLLQREEKIFLLLSLFIYLFWTFSFTTSNYGPDEYMRYDIPKYIFSNGSLPYGWEESIRNQIWGVSYGFNIQLPYLISAYFMNIMSLLSESKTMLLIASRFSSVLSMTGVAFFAICITRKIYQDNPIRWVFVILISLLPQLVFLSSYHNLDVFSLLSVMMIIYAWLQCFEKKWDICSSIHLAVALAVCLLSYEFSYGYIVLSAILYCIWSIQNRKERPFRVFFSYGLLIVGIVLVICGWKFIRSAILYNGDFLSLNASRPYAEQFAMEGYKPSEKYTIAGDGIGIIQMLQVTPWIWTTFTSTLGVFGYMNINLQEWVYKVYEIMIITGLLGFIISLFLRRDRTAKEWLVIIGLFFSGLFAILISIYYSWSSDYQAQGRYIIASLPGIFLAITTGFNCIANLVTPREKRENRTAQKWISKAVFLYTTMTMLMGYIACLQFFGIMN